MTNDVPQPGVAETASPRPADPLYVVGIGASAGGLAALCKLFRELPAEPGVAFVVVVHLSPVHESHLAELLQPHCPMPVQQITRTVALERNRVYVIPPNANLNAIDTHLRLSELELPRLKRAPIDHFLRTLAASHDGTAIGVILTGTGSDGSLGIRQIKECGGLTLAQCPREAECDSMPRNAIATGMIDLILPVREIAGEILRYCSTHPRLPAPGGDDVIAGPEDAGLAQVLVEVRMRTGQEISMYTRATVLRRVRRRMQLRHVETLSAYLEKLRLLPGEAHALYEDLLFTATEFFREPEVVAWLEERIFPQIFDLKSGPHERLRVWSIGCSTGEEAYSLAILMLEEASRRQAPPALRVFASDLSSHALARAREGLYPEEIASSVSAERLERFFIHESGRYCVQRAVRDVVVFAAHNLFKAPPFAHLDLIVCRNLLCELHPAVRRGVLSLFHYALEPHGILVVGDKDEIGDTPLFQSLQGNGRMLRRASGPAQPLSVPTAMEAFAHLIPAEAAESLERTSRSTFLYDLERIHRKVSDKYAPASMMVNAANEVVHYSTRASRFVRIPGGELTHDVAKLIQEPLRLEIEVGLELVRRSGRHWQSEPLQVDTDTGARRVVVHVDRVPPSEAPGLLLVVFEEEAASAPGRTGSAQTHPSPKVADLEAELEQTRARLRELVEARQNERKQLASTNEHLYSANDELHFVLEELESSREELQAVNEELTALDRENQLRLNELAQISADLQHLLESTGVGTLFLDCELRIVRATPPAGELFNVRHADMGRPLTDLTSDLRYDDVAAAARRVLEQQASIDREAQDSRGRWYLTRMAPYRTAGHRVEGVVLTLIDITGRKRAEEALREADRRKDEFIAMLAHELRNPLAPISTGVEILKAGGNDPRVVEQVSSTMGRQTRQLVRLVDDLLEVSRISGGKLHLQKSLVALADVVRDAAAAVRPLIERSGHEFVVAIPEQPILLDADPARLTQVLANLLNNAARYTPKEGRISLTAALEAGDAVISVRDNGIGIPESAIDHVFEMFYQCGDPQQSRKDGLGIGLTLAKSLVEMHGGKISVSSSGSGQGTEFQVRLPQAPRATPAAIAPASPHELAPRRRVLIVDDNIDAAQTLSELMKMLGGHEVHTALGGAQGLQMATNLHPEIVLLDLMMPEMDGYEVARRIRQQPWGKEVTLVALTGWGQEDHRRRTRDAGFDRHLTKPADVASLEAVLGESHSPA